jgi:hypothetical protein
MKQCPNCGRIFADEQSFCLDDGSLLINKTATESQPTIVLPRKKNKFPLVLGGLILLAGTLFGGWLLLASQADDSNQNNRQTAVVTQTPVSLPTPTPPVKTLTPMLLNPSPTPTLLPEANSNVSTNSETKPEISANSKLPEENNPAKLLPIIMKAEDHSVLFALHECRKSGSSITCLFSLTNKGQDRRFRLSTYDSKIFDELGNGYSGSEAQVANQTGNTPQISFIGGVTTRAQMTFDKVEPNAMKITLLNIGFMVGNDYDLSVKFRNVPLIVSK